MAGLCQEDAAAGRACGKQAADAGAVLQGAVRGIRTEPPGHAIGAGVLWPGRPSSSPCSKACRLASGAPRSEEHTSEIQSLMRLSSAVLCLKKKHLHKSRNKHTTQHT